MLVVLHPGLQVNNVLCILVLCILFLLVVVAARAMVQVMCHVVALSDWRVSEVVLDLLCSSHSSMGQI